MLPSYACCGPKFIDSTGEESYLLGGSWFSFLPPEHALLKSGKLKLSKILQLQNKLSEYQLLRHLCLECP
jgi:hypothetical protein